MNVKDKVIKVIMDQLNIADEIELDDHFGKELGSDSLDHIEIIMTLEEEFAIEIPDEEAEKVKTVRDAIELVEKLNKEQN